MYSIIHYSLLFMMALPLVGHARPASPDDVVVFYNLENLFDTVDSPVTQDTDFTPQGRNKWTGKRLAGKLDAIAGTIIAAGSGEFPILVGVCEIENREVLRLLVEKTSLSRIGYGILHRDSPDPRGIDVALLYRSDGFEVLHTAWFKVCYASDSCPTREILYAKGVLHGLDTLHVLVTHWPSKLSGATKSEPRRMRAATTLRAITDSVFRVNPRANIIVMGDFNDTPDSRPITEGLLGGQDTAGTACLHNLMLPLARRGEGSLKYRAKWELVDLFFVSGNLLNSAEPVYCRPAGVSIFRAPFLLVPDERYLGDKVHRTYMGVRYKGGASDHLPITMRLMFR
ncbi:MAG: hypothetical protein LBS12_06475 [Prevotellaceae bacterium]|jgi:endonuclease/exonuclease/phosphatase family metal-dependent hydrolase|nr:hypothetical protein [Prevotellaceae bacterium]